MGECLIKSEKRDKIKSIRDSVVGSPAIILFGNC